MKSNDYDGSRDIENYLSIEKNNIYAFFDCSYRTNLHFYMQSELGFCAFGFV